MRPSSLLVLAAVLGSAAGAIAHVPLVHPSNGSVLNWNNPSNVSIVINSTGSDDISDGSDETALRIAIDEWNAVDGTSINLVENTSAIEQARTDWTASDLHLILFDEDNSSGYFPFGSGTVAITPVWFFSNGRISDADILFNGTGFQFTTSAQTGRFDIGDVATHELGHLLGLDHTPWAGGTMYPFVDPSVTLHRSVSADEITGLRETYPSGTLGRITGAIERLSDNSAVQGANVVARNSAGRPVASILTRTNGAFTLTGLEPGTYDLYVTPLGDGNGGGGDAPVDASNISSFFTVQTDFESTFYPTQATITGTETVAIGTLLVDADVPLNLGTESDDFPIKAVKGMSQTVVIRGSGLNTASTLTASDPDLIVGTPMWFGSQVSFQLTVPANEPNGHVDLMVTNSSGDRSVLTAGLEIAPSAPTVSNVSPSAGALAGGTAVTITGTSFNPGARVVIGDQIYTDGQGGTSVVDPTTITLTTTPTSAGTFDVVVIDATGVEGRATDAFQALPLPVISNVFPAAGFSAGGTDVVISGLDFVPGASVRVNGVDQGTVTVEGSTKLRFTTASGVAGAQTLEVENPGGGLATTAFSLMPQPDPSLTVLTPANGAISGSETVTITGTNFPTDSEVLFDVDPDTGAGGVAAASVTFVDASTLEVVTPAFAASGVTSVLVRDASSMQADVLASAFMVNKKKSSGGGGCYMVPVQGPEGPRSILLGAWWMLVVVLGLGLRARRHESVRAHG